jgi:hypothetical protein
MRAVNILLLVLLVCSIGVCHGCSVGSAQSGTADVQPATPSVTCIERLGLSGAITSAGALVGRLTENGSDVIFLATDDGLYAVSNGRLQWWQPGVRSLALIDDVTGDGARDLVASRGSSIFCYDGVTGESWWRFECGQRRVFVSGLGWGGVDLDVEGIQVLGSGASQIISARSDCYVFGMNALNGEQVWRFRASDRLSAMAVVPDGDGDGTDEFVVGTHEGSLYLVNGGTGEAEWKKKVGEEWLEQGRVRYGSIGSIASVDAQGNSVVIGTRDGRVCVVDLRGGDLEWENRVVDREARGSVGVQVVPDVTGDGLPELLVIRPNGGSSSTPKDIVLLSGADGSEVWTSQMYTTGSAIGSADGQPVLLEPHPQSDIRIISLKDASVMRSLNVVTLDGETPQIRQMSDGGYLVFSNGSDLAGISADGAVQWLYPRVSNTLVRQGQFTSDAIPDLLVCGESTQPADQTISVRLVSVLDGATQKEVWRYEVPWADFATLGGLSSVQLAGDLTGDGIQDVVAYRGSTVFRFSGADGSLAQFDIGESVTYLRSMKLGANATGILVGTEKGLVILDKDGNRLWESAYTDWSGAEVGVVRVLNDLNQDGIDDLVMLFADRILVAKSAGADQLTFETHRSFPAGDNKTLELKEITNDIDGDGVQEIAYFEHDKDKSAETGVLQVVSPVSGKVWHQWNMPVTVDLACADFNGDGFRDSLVYHLGPKAQTTIWSTSSRPDFAQTKLEVYSGKDGSVLWNHTFDEDRWNTGSEKMPAAPVGDITGDGIEDLAVSSVTALEDSGGIPTNSAGVTESRFLHETHVSVYDIANGTLVKEVVLPPVQKDSNVASDEGHYGYFEPVSGPGDAMRLAGDLNRDGRQELAALAGYLPTGLHCLALVDLYNERVLGYSALLNTLDFFETGGDYTLGFTAESSVYLAKVSNELQVTRPSEGATVGSRARIAWEGRTDSSSASVFVDGYENAQTSRNEVTLLLTPGEHEVVIRSVDEFGIVTYATVHLKVAGSPWISILAGAAVMALLLLYFAARCVRVMRNRRAQREES